MLDNTIFKRPKNSLEGTDPQEIAHSTCPSCEKNIPRRALSENKRVCPSCGYYFKLTSRQRIGMIADAKSFIEFDKELKSTNFLDFPGYDAKLEKSMESSGEKEGVVTGLCTISGNKCAIFVMEPGFIMGSMGSAVGEKITRIFEYAEENMLSVVGVTVSGGARMQEGIYSLMQMAKVSGAVKKHNDKGLFYLALLTDPTTGGVTASFAMQADVIIAEPKALIGFAGPRVIEQTIRQKLPAGFQKAEYLLESGFLDDIVERKTQKSYIAKMLRYHNIAEEADL